MEEYRRRLELLTGKNNIWEEYNPTVNEDVLTGSDLKSSQMGIESSEMSSSTANGVSYGTTDLALAGGPVETPPNHPPCQKPDGHGIAGTELGTAYPDTGLNKGDLSPPDGIFCPWKFVTEYPKMFVGKVNSERSAPYFLPTAIYENRVWDFFYLHDPSQQITQPTIFVPTYQFENFLDFVNAELNVQLEIPGGKNVEKFKMQFGLGNTPRPRFLGRTMNGEEFRALIMDIPPLNPEDTLENVSAVAKSDFQERLEMIRNAHGKRKNHSQKNRFERIARHKAWGRSIKRVQRYLGLRQKMTTFEGGSETLDNSLELNSPIKTKPEGSVVFISIDIEAYEFNQDIITEIGLAVFDTLEIQQTPPGDGGRNWLPLIRAHHIRIKENSWAHNKKHVKGCAENFDFGTSKFVSNRSVGSLVNRIMIEETSPKSVSDSTKAKTRPVVLVFHDSGQDLKYLKALGIDVFKTQDIIDIADTRDMCQYIDRTRNPTKLATVLSGLGLQYRYLHNAGNDAVYTLQVMIGLAIKKRQISLHGEEPPKGNTLEGEGNTGHSNANLPNNEASSNSVPEPEEDEGWISGGELSDGGDPVKPVNPYPLV